MKAAIALGTMATHIILMNNTNAKETTVEVLPYIIETLINEGYTLKALDEK